MPAVPLEDPRLQVFDLLAHALWITDPDAGCFMWANREGLSLWNAASLDELVNRDLQLSPPVQSLLMQLRDRAASGERIVQERTIFPRGEPKRVEMVIVAFPLLTGRTVILVDARPVHGFDPEAVRASEAVRHAPLVVATFTLDGLMLQANTRARSVFGNDLSFHGIFAHAEEAEYILSRVALGETISEDVEVKSTAGEKWYAIEARRVTDPVTGNYALLMSAHDMSARIEAERAKEDLISVVSHELRTPMTAIRGAIDLILGGITAGQPDLEAELLQIASENTARMSRLVDDLLDVRKLAAGGMSLQVVETSLLAVVRSSLEANLPAAHMRGIDIDFSVHDEVMVFADPSRIAQVVLNLLSNANKHSPPGSTVRVSVFRKGDLARVEVTDQGPGVPEAFRSKIFMRFSQADASSTRAGSGTGLGLYISKTIIDLHGGKLGFESPKEGGTTFFFELPITDQK